MRQHHTTIIINHHNPQRWGTTTHHPPFSSFGFLTRWVMIFVFGDCGVNSNVRASKQRRRKRGSEDLSSDSGRFRQRCLAGKKERTINVAFVWGTSRWKDVSSSRSEE
ncbi:hypothetical protein MLD38_004062 [Melastoma candidum]|uniref:Uncharacterized protein n=1 Tax=Melastoma candidum TaxID=119954 RepID=A0ACB9S410_9MYRT|nr:hypothetical protein MLD38_004062 [Melastoma candidum]